jgi:hypothetical protein
MRLRMRVSSIPSLSGSSPHSSGLPDNLNQDVATD